MHLAVFSEKRPRRSSCNLHRRFGIPHNTQIYMRRCSKNNVLFLRWPHTDQIRSDPSQLIRYLSWNPTQSRLHRTKKGSKSNKSQTLLRHSITYHYNLITLSTSDANQKNSRIRRQQHLTPVLKRQRHSHLSWFRPDGWFCSRSASASVTTCTIGSVNSLRPRWVYPVWELPCLIS